jgi:ABC-type dipeptide/oligopeptide/nickel transport system permease subunit
VSATVSEAIEAVEAGPGLPGGRLRERLAPLISNPLAMFGAVVAAFFVVVGLVGAVIVLTPSLRHLYLDQSLSQALHKPLTNGHLLGTDNLGRDMVWRIVAGTGISLLVGVAVTALSVLVGMTLGALAGYYGGRIDAVISGLIDLTWGFPLLLVAAIVVGAVGAGLTAVVLAVALVNWAGFARIIRAEALSLREREFVEAARALGVSDRRMILRHIVPNTIGSTLVMSSYYIAQTVIVEAGLAFIGLGAQPPTPSLGQMISTGRDYLYVDAWAAITPGIMIALIVLGLNTLGDGLRDVFDPRTRRWS